MSSKKTTKKGSQNIKVLLILVVIIIFAAAGVFAFQTYQKAEEVKKISSFEACAKAGYPVRESYPSTCSTPDGRTFTEEVSQGKISPEDALVEVASPKPNQKITRPLQISGQARGNWYFEATFPVEVVDENNNSLGKGYATAQGEWMTEAFVPFTGEVAYETPTTPTGKIIINNGNPSGLPENEEELVIPVVF